VTTAVHDILKLFRDSSDTNRERGTRFEELMVQYLRTDPQWSSQFSNVWMWADSPLASADKRDVGIDLVALDIETGGYCAIQCKFYEPDHSVQKADIDSFFTASGKGSFSRRMIISTTEKWGSNAEAALADQQIPVTRIGLADIAASPVDWDVVWPKPGEKIELRLGPKKSLRPHQTEAVEAVFSGFADHNRGKLIMACGTGKTFTSLKVAERLAAGKGEGETTRVLFLVPSISLLSQSLREWTAECQTALHSFAVCSDAKVSKQGRDSDSQDMNTHDLALPATTDPDRLIQQMQRVEANHGLTVIFSTYQSITTVAQAQRNGLPDFDIILCDEAHRTTGVTLPDKDDSQFVKVHDSDFIKAKRRLYMTATPRLFDDNTKSTAKQNDAVLCSMDDERLYGPEFHRLGFGKAVEQGLLTDYKVLILSVDEQYVATSLQAQLADDNNELTLDDAAKIVGCWNGLAKRSGHALDDGSGFKDGEPSMRRAVAFARNISESKLISDRFAQVVEQYDRADEDFLRCEVRHVDGSFNSLERNKRLNWLKEDPGENACRILSNARCLSEGVDVPDLDAVLFLHPRNSVVDVVQSVGRVMRKADGKDYGYIILPVGIPAGMAPETALAENKRFKVVWQCLQALRAHDDRFNATVNQIDLNQKRPDNILVGHVGPSDEVIGDGSSGDKPASQLALQWPIEEWRDAIYTRIVTKVGERHYWEDWAKDVAVIADRHVARIKAALSDPTKRAAFERFLKELQANINPGVNEASAIDMLAQHLITKPVFDALFAGYEFSSRNPVSQAMQRMLDTLEDQAIGKEAETLESFYASVRTRAEGIDNHEGRQKVITELYEKFFKTALPKTADAFGIVYTPIEVVDFILRATDHALSKYFESSLSDEGVHIIDPFTGTGTFMVRLLQTGLIKPHDVLRKYTSELHANEIVLLAYYIAAVNIEAAFHQQLDGEDYVPFGGIVLTDTFQLAEDNKQLEVAMFGNNSDRVRRQQQQDIRVIIGNPPYSVGQDNANDDNQNLKYEVLDERIKQTYAALSTATNKNSLYDSYVRAIRWASDRIKDEGIVAYVSNGGYIDGNTADGLRKALAEEFDAIYCYNLRGNQRTAGELSRKEGGKIFDSGSRNTVAILIVVKGGKSANTVADCELHYRDIGDYLSRDDKLRILTAQDLDTVDWQRILPNSDGDWINQRDARFATFRALGDKTAKGESAAIFALHSPGLQTNRDAWVYNHSRQRLGEHVEAMIDFYNEQTRGFREHCMAAGITSPKPADAEKFIDRDPKRISWSSSLISKLAQGKEVEYAVERAVTSMYRPFDRQVVYFDRDLNHRPGKLPQMFTTPDHPNFGFYVNGFHATADFAVLATDLIPCLDVFGKGGYFFSRYTYRELAADGGFDFGENDAYERVDNITDTALRAYQKTYDDAVTKDDIFYYAYGLLHSPEYRTQFAADLKKSLPRIPKVRDFYGFAEAGRKLAELHIGYEVVEPFGLEENISGSASIPPSELYRVQKMRFGVKGDRSIIVYNNRITLSGIPEEAYRYQLGARSAVEWVIDRYQVKTDKSSGIVNDPNDWSDDPRYIIDLIKKIVTVSLETVRIVDALPEIDILE
jgi:predicted helicase